jgi:TctA family transporter
MNCNFTNLTGMILAVILLLLLLLLILFVYSWKCRFLWWVDTF